MVAAVPAVAALPWASAVPFAAAIPWVGAGLMGCGDRIACRVRIGDRNPIGWAAILCAAVIPGLAAIPLSGGEAFEERCNAYRRAVAGARQSSSHASQLPPNPLNICADDRPIAVSPPSSFVLFLRSLSHSTRALRQAAPSPGGNGLAFKTHGLPMPPKSSLPRAVCVRRCASESGQQWWVLFRLYRPRGNDSTARPYAAR